MIPNDLVKSSSSVMSIFMDFPSSVKISIIPDDLSVDPPAKDRRFFAEENFLYDG